MGKIGDVGKPPVAPVGENNGSPGDDPLVLLQSSGAKARESALKQLEGDTRPEVLAAVSAVLRADPNANVRRTAARVLAGFGAPAGAVLLEGLQKDDEEPFVQAAVARALGRPGGDEAVSQLAAVAQSTDDDKLQDECVQALRKIASPSAAQALADVFPHLSEGYLQALAITALGEIGGAPAESAIESWVGSKHDGVRKAVASALGSLRPPRALEFLMTLCADQVAGVRLRGVENLAKFAPGDVVGPLTDALLDDSEHDVRDGAAKALASLPRSVQVIDGFLTAVAASDVERAHLDSEALTIALAPAMREGLDDGTRLPDRLIDKALDADDRLTSVIAEILISCSGHDAKDAGVLVNAYERAHPDTAERLKRLRIDVGGKQALDPILQQLRDDLEQYFQKPIHDLNESTQQSWQQSVIRARQAFSVRMIMSVTVFVVGILLVIASSIRFFVGGLDTAHAWGTGGTLVGGLTTMLAITYTGPLKDIRQSINDLGSATVTFIGYVHQVLQISHTFTALYLREQITFDDVDKASTLLRVATRDAVASLTGTPAVAPPEPPAATGTEPARKR